MRKILCWFLSIICVLQLTQNAWATEVITASAEDEYSYSFVDSEGKENTLVITICDTGDVIVACYIEGQFMNSARSTVTSENEVTATTIYADGATDVEQIAFSDGNETSLQKELSAQANTSPVYTYAGRVNFGGHYEGYAPGTYHTHTWDVYEALQSVVDEYKDINIGAGTAVSAAVGIVIAVLTTIAFPVTAATEIAEALVIAAISSVGGTIAGGVVQSFVYKRYYVRSWKYLIKVSDLDSGKSKVYSGDEYRVYLDGGGYSSELHYSGRRNWWSLTVLSLMWPDFWNCGMPVVSSITYA